MKPDEHAFTLVYSGECPYCRAIAATVGHLDPAALIDLVEIESDVGRKLVEDWHGEYVHAPHFRYGNRFAYGVVPAGVRLTAMLPFISLGSVGAVVWDRLTTATTRGKDSSNG